MSNISLSVLQPGNPRPDTHHPHGRLGSIGPGCFKVLLWVGCMLSIQSAIAEEDRNSKIPTPDKHNKLPGATEATKPLGDTRILSLLDQKDQVFASTEIGLFRAKKSAQKWERLPTPSTMPLGGFFAKQPECSTEVYYSAAVPPNTPKDKEKDLVRGLYRSLDAGRNWQVANSQYQFNFPFLHSDGILYSIIGLTGEMDPSPGEKLAYHYPDGKKVIYYYDRIIMSGDKGNTWKDISGDTSRGLSLYGFFQDPDHPDLVCVSGNHTRGYILQANDKNYRWNEIREDGWFMSRETDDSFMSKPYYTSGSIFYTDQATLSNYFTHPFNGHLEIPAFQLVTDKRAYQFKKGGPMAVQATVSFICRKPDVKFIDLENSSDLWSVAMIPPNGKLEWLKPRMFERSNQSLPEDKRVAIFRSSRTVQTHIIGGDRTFQRTIDLRDFGDFSELGIYRMRLSYDNGEAADRKNDEWIGGFTSPEFKVTITE